MEPLILETGVELNVDEAFIEGLIQLTRTKCLQNFAILCSVLCPPNEEEEERDNEAKENDVFSSSSPQQRISVVGASKAAARAGVAVVTAGAQTVHGITSTVTSTASQGIRTLYSSTLTTGLRLLGTPQMPKEKEEEKEKGAEKEEKDDEKEEYISSTLPTTKKGDNRLAEAIAKYDDSAPDLMGSDDEKQEKEEKEKKENALVLLKQLINECLSFQSRLSAS